MTHNTTLAVKNHFYYGKESLFLYEENAFKTDSGTQHSGIFRFVNFVILVKVYALPLRILVRFLLRNGM